MRGTLRLRRALGSSSLLLLTALAPAAGAPPLAGGQATGSLTVKGKAIPLSHAAAFTDPRENELATVLVLSDTALPAAQWKKASDMSLYRNAHGFRGVAFWVDAKGEVFRCEYYDGTDFPTSTSGIFDLKLERAGGFLSGTARSTQAAAKLSEPVKLDASFRVAAR